MRGLMKAIRVDAPGGPEAMHLADVPDPEPREGEVLVRVEAAGVNFIDVYHRTGAYPLQFPLVPGQEGAGVVVSVGPGVVEVAPGDRVAYAGVPGGYAELVAIPAGKVVPVPEGIPTKVAAAVMLQGMTAHYLATSTYPLKPGDACLVHAAAGGVGLLLSQIARIRGGRVFGTVSGEGKAKLAQEAGAETIIYTQENFAAEVRKRTGGAGVAVVYDGVGRDTFEGSLDSLAIRGTLALFGQSSGPVPPFDPQVLNRKGSLFLTRPTLGHYVATRAELLSRAGDLFTWIAAGELDVRIGAEFALADAADAHRALEARRTTGKVVLRTDDSAP